MFEDILDYHSPSPIMLADIRCEHCGYVIAKLEIEDGDPIPNPEEVWGHKCPKCDKVSEMVRIEFCTGYKT